MTYLLDTNICVHWLRGRYDVDKAIDRVGIDNCRISEITAAELLTGANIARLRGGKKDSVDIVKEFIALLRPVPISDAIELYAQEKARLRSEGLVIEDFDLLIGCSAVSAGAVLVSENSTHLQRIHGIRLETWITR